MWCNTYVLTNLVLKGTSKYSGPEWVCVCAGGLGGGGGGGRGEGGKYGQPWVLYVRFIRFFNCLGIILSAAIIKKKLTFWGG